MSILSIVKRHVPKKYLYPGLALLVIGGALFAYWIYNSIKISIDSVGSGSKVTCPMNGVKTSKDKTERRPFAVMVENSIAARPQSGLDKADVVYEALAEGGITRMMAVYACGGDDAKSIGPVRSARTYFVDWLQGFDGFYAHAGGSSEALDLIQEDNILDLQNFGDGTYFWRSSSRPAPHNLYTGYENLVAFAKKKNYNLKATYEELLFKDDAAIADRGDSQEIVVNFSGANYRVGWIYNKEKNEYSRYLAKSPHNDLVTGKQLKAKVIIIERIKQNVVSANDNHLLMDTIGTGEAFIFEDGKVISGTWEKKFKGDREAYYDEEGNEIALNAGQIWIEIVKPETKIDY